MCHLTPNPGVILFEVFVNNTNLTFLYKISIDVSLKIKVASSGN